MFVNYVGKVRTQFGKNFGKLGLMVKKYDEKGCKPYKQ